MPDQINSPKYVSTSKALKSPSNWLFFALGVLLLLDYFLGGPGFAKIYQLIYPPPPGADGIKIHSILGTFTDISSLALKFDLIMGLLFFWWAVASVIKAFFSDKRVKY